MEHMDRDTFHLKEGLYTVKGSTSDRQHHDNAVILVDASSMRQRRPHYIWRHICYTAGKHVFFTLALVEVCALGVPF